MTPTITVHQSYNSPGGGRFNAEFTDLKPGTYELHPVGGLHVGRVPCGNCGGTGRVFHCAAHPDEHGPDVRWADCNATDQAHCGSCGEVGAKWPDWAIEAVGNNIYGEQWPDLRDTGEAHWIESCTKVLDALLAQEGDSHE